ncbi:uncharacterized protein LOC118145468 isoform X1 [Callithrix jacchus]|uniref:uncharacterized protein LOC118145468 n=1 Tax=Callithrix jacchus TaxID=9483 RepID=UPI00159DE878|nr:uncharacterized protein LOC118145468 [Callithrix jacchus]
MPPVAPELTRTKAIATFPRRGPGASVCGRSPEWSAGIPSTRVDGTLDVTSTALTSCLTEGCGGDEGHTRATRSFGLRLEPPTPPWAQGGLHTHCFGTPPTRNLACLHGHAALPECTRLGHPLKGQMLLILTETLDGKSAWHPRWSYMGTCTWWSAEFRGHPRVWGRLWVSVPGPRLCQDNPIGKQGGAGSRLAPRRTRPSHSHAQRRSRMRPPSLSHAEVANVPASGITQDQKDEPSSLTWCGGISAFVGLQESVHSGNRGFLRDEDPTAHRIRLGLPPNSHRVRLHCSKAWQPGESNVTALCLPSSSMFIPPSPLSGGTMSFPMSTLSPHGGRLPGSGAG